MTIAAPDCPAAPAHAVRRQWAGGIALVAAMTLMGRIFACVIARRPADAYYCTWSKENVFSFLDHPPMIAWFIRFGTAIFGDSNLGVRFAGLLAMLVMPLLLADI